MSGVYPSQGEFQLTKLIASIRDLFAGRNNAFGTFTLTTGTSTVVDAPNCAPDSVPLFSPFTLHAAQEYAAGTMFVSQVKAGKFTITHAASVNTDRIFGYHTSG